MNGWMDGWPRVSRRWKWWGSIEATDLDRYDVLVANHLHDENLLLNLCTHVLLLNLLLIENLDRHCFVGLSIHPVLDLAVSPFTQCTVQVILTHRLHHVQSK